MEYLSEGLSIKKEKKKSFYKIKLIVFLPRPAGTRLGQCLVILLALSSI